MASIAWTTGIGLNPVKVITMQGTGVYARCDYTLDAGQTWTNALLIVSSPRNEPDTPEPAATPLIEIPLGTSYEHQMVKDKPKAGQCEGTVLPIPTGTYFVQAKLYFKWPDKSDGIVNSTTVQITV